MVGRHPKGTASENTYRACPLPEAYSRPPAWPGWAVALGRGATAVFGVTRAYEDIQPWRSVQHHMDQIAFETAAGGSLYSWLAHTQTDPLLAIHIPALVASCGPDMARTHHARLGR